LIMGITTDTPPQEEIPQEVVNQHPEGEDVQDETIQQELLESVQQFLSKNDGYWQKPEDGVEGKVEESERVYESMVKDKDQLHRILVARNFHIKKSRDLFLEQVRFRARWTPESIDPASIPVALPSGAIRRCGYSREDCVALNFKLRLWKADDYGASSEEGDEKRSDDQLFQDGIDEFTRYILYCIELAISSMKPKPVPQKFVVIFDLVGFTASMVFKRNVRLMVRKLIYIAQAQYPERLHKCLLINAPYGFSTAWKLVRALLDEKTASKVHFVSTQSVTDDFDPEVLSSEYGGQHAEYPVE